VYLFIHKRISLLNKFLAIKVALMRKANKYDDENKSKFCLNIAT